MTDVTTYSAVCVRACAIRGSRVSRAMWQSLLGLPSVADVIQQLAIAGIVSTAGLSAPDAQYEVRQRFIVQASKLVRFSESNLRRVMTCFIRSYDLLNVESVICAIHGGTPHAPARLQDTGRFGLFTPPDLASVGSLAVLGRLLEGTVLAAPYADAVELYSDDRDLARFLTALERASLADWFDAARSAGLDDNSVMGTVLRMKAAVATMRLSLRGEKPHMLSPWVRLLRDPSSAENLINRRLDPPALFAELAGPDLRPGGGSDAWPPSSPALAERAAARQAVAAARRVESRLAFNASFPVGFIVVQQRETEDLVTLIEGKELGLKPAEIGELLVGA